MQGAQGYAENTTDIVYTTTPTQRDRQASHKTNLGWVADRVLTSTLVRTHNGNLRVSKGREGIIGRDLVLAPPCLNHARNSVQYAENWYVVKDDSRFYLLHRMRLRLYNLSFLDKKQIACIW